MNAQLALLEMTLMNAEVDESNFDDVYIAGTKMGIPAEVMTRLRSIWNETKLISGEVVAVGKIIVTRIFEFLKANPRIAAGAAMGCIVAFLISTLPMFGWLLVPLAKILSISFAAYGAATTDGLPGGLIQGLTVLAEKFFELLVNVFNGVTQYLEAKP